jgi:hypothetical protein
MEPRIERITCGWCKDTLEAEKLRQGEVMTCFLCEDIPQTERKDQIDFAPEVVEPTGRVF